MFKKVIQSGVIAFASIFLVAAYSQASPMAGNEVTLTNVGTNNVFPGGEFLLKSNSGDYSFITFCLEKNEYFYPGNTYTIQSVTDYANRGGVGGAIDGKDYISNATKWLMNEYIFNYDNLKDSMASTINANQFAGDVQNAIWFFEQEITDENYLATYVDGLGDTMDDYDSSFLSNIQVANIVTYNSDDSIRTFNQSQLFANPVPEPATMLLFGTGLVGLAAIGRKKIRR